MCVCVCIRYSVKDLLSWFFNENFFNTSVYAYKNKSQYSKCSSEHSLVLCQVLYSTLNEGMYAHLVEPFCSLCLPFSFLIISFTSSRIEII